MDFESQLLSKIEKLDEDMSQWFGKGPTEVGLCEVFIVNHKDQLKADLIHFLKQEFNKGELKPVHLGLSTTEFNPNDWLNDIAENVVNRLIQYFETIRGQTERNL